MTTLKKISVICILSLAVSSANADEIVGFGQGDWLLSGGVTYYGDFNESAADEGYGPGLALAYGITDRWAIEFLYSRYEFKNSTALSFSDNSNVYMLNGMYSLFQTQAYQSYLVFGASVVDEIRRDKYEEFRDEQLHAGIGILYTLTDNLFLRADVRANYSLEYSELQPFSLLGLTYKFSGAQK